MTAPQFTQQRMAYALQNGTDALHEATVMVDHRELRAWARLDGKLDGSEPTLNAWSCWHALKRRGEWDGSWEDFDERCAWAVVAEEEAAPDPTNPAPSAGSSPPSPSAPG